ncbi:hypothetical protein FRB95_009530 [Tulasnella sp. JGI-2019a]|nr:hypothetical protein FRB95_009530 [Tulasnella sp. JGI-2019a]
MDQYIDRALACLIEGVDNQAMPSSPLDKREWILEDLDLLRLSYEQLGQSVHHHIADTFQRLNSRAPIHRLPDELFIKIITLALVPKADDHKDYRQRLIGLGLVSKHWNRNIHGTASLWTQISTAHSDRENRNAVLRSKGYPLRVLHSDRDYISRNGKAETFFDIATREAYRWRSAEFGIYSNRTKALLYRFVLLSVPILEELKIDLSEGLSGEDGIDIPSGGADRLRHVELSFFPIPPSSRLLSGLETLKITGWPSTCPLPSTSEIADILRRCPKLRVFDFRSFSNRKLCVSGARPSEAGVIYLPALTSLSLYLGNANASRQIISSVRIPACTSLTLNCIKSMRNIFSNEGSHLAAALISTIQSVPEVLLSLKSSLFTLYDRIRMDIKINIYSDSPGEDLAWFVEHITGPVAWPPVDATISCDFLSFHSVITLLLKMPSIAKLTLTGPFDQYIRLLSHPTLNNGIYEWVLPNLRELSLKDSSRRDPQVLTDLSSKRQQGDNMDRGDGILLGLPVKPEAMYI